MRRVAGALAILLLAPLPAVLTGCQIDQACACTTPPTLDPNWTPPAVSADQAATYAAKFADVPSMEAGLVSPPTGPAYYLATDTGTAAVALVDPSSGSVTRTVRADLMPNDESLSIGDSTARSAAEAFLGRVGLSAEGFSATIETVRVAGVAAYRVDWHDGSGLAAFQVLVNGSTAAVFAYADLRAPGGPALPVVGRGRASALAIATFGDPGETVIDAEFAIDGGHWLWQVGMGVPSVSDPEVFERGGYLTVDAVSGEVTIVKDAR
jgi:hypothetical protein